MGVDIMATGNAPATSKYKSITDLQKPRALPNWRLLIGLFGFYRKWLPYYKTRVAGWRQKCKQPTKKEKEKLEKAQLPEPPDADKSAKIKELWTKEDEQLLDQLKKEIICGPVLKHPNFKQRFYLKTDWSSLAKAAVLCQAECSKEAEEALRKELKGSKCEFDKTIKGLRLWLIAFIDQMNKEKEWSYHSHKGEIGTGKWAFGKFQFYL